LSSTATPLDGVIFGTCTGLGVVVTALCAYRARMKPTVATRCITLAFGICTVGVFFAVPAVASRTEEITGIDNLPKLIAHTCAILWCVSLQLAMVDIAYAPTYLRVAVMRRSFVAVAVLAAMIPIWLSTNQSGLDFTTAHAKNPAVRVYLILYLLYTFFTCTELAFMCAKSATYNWPGRPWSSFGYGASAVAAVFGLAYSVSRGGYLVAYTAGHPWSLELEEKMSPLLAGVAILFLFVGLTLPLVGTLLKGRKMSTS
jgi:hypothetical protein